MKLVTALWLAMWLTPAAAQSTIDRTNQIMTFSYPMDSGWTMQLWSSALLPQAKGGITVVRGSIATEIDILVNDLRPPESLGADRHAYVVWLIAPDGMI